MIELKNVSKYYHNNGVVAIGLKNINLSFEKNEIVAITGESGSGKSTLLNVICGVDTYEDGEIYFNGEETSYFNQDDMDNYRKKHVSFIYQNYNIIESYSVLENVMLPLIINGYSEADAKKRAKELIKEVGLEHRIRNKGAKLSGGEKQRCVIARALATDAEILACDEPTGNLDSKTGAEIIEVIRKVAKDKLVLIVTHNYEQVKDIVTRSIMLSDGEVQEDNVLVSPEVTEEPLKEEEEGKDSVKKSVYFKLALKNIKNTPRKTIFSLLVFMVLGAIAFIAYLACITMAEDTDTNSSASYRYKVSERVVFFDKTGNGIDLSKFDLSGYDYEANSFLEEYGAATGSGLDFYLAKHIPNSLEEEEGTKELGSNDIYILLSEYADSDYISYAEDNLDKNIIIKDDSGKTYPFTLKGYAVCKEITSPTIVFSKDYEVPSGFYSDISSKITCIHGTDEVGISYYSYEDKTSITYFGPTDPGFNISEFTFKLNGFTLSSISAENVDYEYIEDSDTSYYKIYVSADDIKFDRIYELSVYGNSSSDVKKLVSMAKDAGYQAFIPSDMGVKKASLSYILAIFFYVLATIAIIVVTLVTYLVLSRVYASRDRDYAIMRSLGLVRKKMKKIVNWEIILLGMSGSVLAVVIFYVINIFWRPIGEMLQYNSFGFMVIYFLLMLLFSALIASRFNRRLFKFSVSTSVKGDVVRND